MNRITLLIFCACFAGSCATSNLTSFKDPDFMNHTFFSIAVLAQGMRLDAALEVEKMMCEKVKPTICKPVKSILPPTRSYTTSEIDALINRSGVEAVLMISLISDEIDTRYIGSTINSYTTGSAQTSGKAFFYGNHANYNSNTNYSSSTQTNVTPEYSTSRNATAIVNLFDWGTGKTAWSGEINVVGRGVLGSKDSVLISSATDEIADNMISQELIR